MSKKLLLITYYWPPLSGGGVFRWLKMCKYLPEYGWQSTVFTPENGSAPIIDNTLVEETQGIEVIRYPIKEPYELYKTFTGKKGKKINTDLIQQSGNWKQQLSLWIRGNLFIPDARKWWIKPASRYLSQHLKTHTYDAIISTGPPHSMHLVALQTQRNNIPWVADFRDPWTNIDFYHKLKLSSYADKKHKQLEQRVLQECDEIVTVTPTWQKDFEALSNRKVHLFSNGFDPKDFEELPSAEDKFTITYTGSMNEDRNISNFWLAIRKFIDNRNLTPQKLELRIVGTIDPSVHQFIQDHQLQTYCSLVGNVSHNEAVMEMGKASLLYLPINQIQQANDGIIPGKFYEYLAAQRPILCIGDQQSDVSNYLQSAQGIHAIKPSQTEEIQQFIADVFDEKIKLKGQFHQFSRKTIAGDYATFLEHLTVE